jgi:hypothetical protein
VCTARPCRRVWCRTGNPAESIWVIRGAWQRWLTHGVIDEFSRIEEIKGQRIKNVLSAAKPRRQIVATALANCPADEWISVDSLFTTMRQKSLSPTIARNDRALWKLYLVDPQYGSLGYLGYLGYHEWEILEGRYTLAVLFEYAGTLGLIDLDYANPPSSPTSWPAEPRTNCPPLCTHSSRTSPAEQGN